MTDYPIPRYEILEATSKQELERRVNIQLRDGWLVHGQLVITDARDEMGFTYSQVMVRSQNLTTYREG